MSDKKIIVGQSRCPKCDEVIYSCGDGSASCMCTVYLCLPKQRDPGVPPLSRFGGK